ncbi:MAG: hypothetical protein ACPGAN_00545 [Candidatus Poseidoniaceae archaeon]
MTNIESNGITKLAWLALSVILFFIGVILVGSVIFNPYGTAGGGQVISGLFLISAGLVLPFMKNSRNKTQK